MEFTKDETHGVAYLKLRQGKVKETVEIKPGILFDLNKEGDVLGIEILSFDLQSPTAQKDKL